MAPDRALAEPWLRAGEELLGLVEVRLSALVPRPPKPYRQHGRDVDTGAEIALNHGLDVLDPEGLVVLAGLTVALVGGRLFTPPVRGGWESTAGRFAAAAREAELSRTSETFGCVLLAVTDRRTLLLKRRGALGTDHLVDLGPFRLRGPGAARRRRGRPRRVGLRFTDGSTVAVRVAPERLKALAGLAFLSGRG
ncbi:hypothetical protein ABT093_26515 [Kitasatospora sp. NPDC002551]|uniref:hypothetical protein n=1 Tax=Kitasatospora sp. NPDC002551 TaxID=3154539 RepID=UPI003334130C